MKTFVVLVVAITGIAHSALLRHAGEQQGGVITPQLEYIANVDGKFLFIDRYAERNWTEASDFCKSKDMELISITSETQFDALNSANIPDWRNGSASWTSGRESQGIEQFKWNTTDTALDASYLQFDSSRFIEYQTCVAFTKFTNASYLHNALCSTRWTGTLCEMHI